MGSLDVLTQEPLGLAQFLMNLVIAGALSLALRWHYIRYGTSLSDRMGLANVFPMIVLTTVIVISVVKASLALSLGLVGALSIIRFRTPIKEPEELAYLFICIAIGIGLGASQTLATLIGVGGCMLAIVFISKQKAKVKAEPLYLTIGTNQKDGLPDAIDQLSEALAEICTFCDLHRLDAREANSTFTYFIQLDGAQSIGSLTRTVQGILPDASVTLLDQRRIPGV